VLADVIRDVVRGDGGALGASWLATYLLANGSVVAALSITLFAADVVPLDQVFLLVAGSRLGAASIVLLLGGLEYLRRRQYTLRKATSLGVLAFLLTMVIYLPATLLGHLSLPWLRPHLTALTRSMGVTFQPLGLFSGATGGIVDVLGPAPAFAAGIVLLYACLETFDRLLETVDPSVLRRRFFGRLERKWLSFLVGLVVTGATTSVAFSLGVIVAPYNRGYVKREEIVPYVLGANIGTLLDTVVVAYVLGTEAGAVAVLALIGWAGLLTGGVLLLLYGPFLDGVADVHDGLQEDRRWFLAFLVALVAAPLLLVLFP
jgi:sodium-dependent phosphate cotransporter